MMPLDPLNLGDCAQVLPAETMNRKKILRITMVRTDYRVRPKEARGGLPSWYFVPSVVHGFLSPGAANSREFSELQQSVS